MLFLGVMGVVVGGRLGYCLFYKPGYYLQHPLEIFFVWQGGMSFHGGMLGVIASHGVVRALARQAVLAGDGFRRALRAAGPGGGARRQLHQRRAVGPLRPTPTLPWAHGVPAKRLDGAAPSVAGLPVPAGRRAAVRAAVALRAQGAQAGAGVGDVPDRLRRVALHRRILPRARRLPGPAGARHEHGPVAVRADGPGRHLAVSAAHRRAARPTFLPLRRRMHRAGS